MRYRGVRVAEVGPFLKEGNKRRLCNRMVYNDWGLYSFAQVLEYKCLRFGQELYIKGRQKFYA